MKTFLAFLFALNLLLGWHLYQKGRKERQQTSQRP